MAHLPVLPSVGKQVINVVLCLTIFTFIFLYFRRYVYLFPITFESIWQISLAEVNRRKNVRRIRNLEQSAAGDEEKGTGGKKAATRHIASVVGYREEPNLFRKCLQSYAGSPGLEMMLVGIDGDHAEDMEMVRIVEQVFPETLVKIHIDEPYGPLAVRIAQGYVDRKMEDEKGVEFKPHGRCVDPDEVPKELLEESYKYACRMVFEKAVSTLQDHGVLKIPNKGGLPAICLYQPHICKKDIMFTNMVFSLALGQANDIEYLWTSDSDTWVYPETLYHTIGCMSTDPLIGGSCSALSIHNGGESMIAGLGAAAYWTELAITRGQTGAVDSVDCQPGPCAAFKLIALESILLKWYTQTSIGVKTVVNEDRHLTTNLLLNGWKVTFNTQTLASTDTPTTLLRWLLQQMRWARATHIETFQYPKVYSIHGPILFVTAMRRFYGPLIIGVFTIRYVLTGYTVHTYSLTDLLGRIVLCTAYNRLVNKDNVNGVGYLIFSQMFYQLPLPGIMFWSVVTALEGGWGTRMRNQSETRKGRRAGFDNLWSTTAVVVWMGFVGAAFARFIAVRIAPQLMVQLMLVSSSVTVISLYYALLG
ncbi:glycosyltransferase family 2 protein [Halenospora varia]|nr:glycosyltransferase family 2 protein [Halenospora varia]